MTTPARNLLLALLAVPLLLLAPTADATTRLLTQDFGSSSWSWSSQGASPWGQPGYDDTYAALIDPTSIGFEAYAKTSTSIQVKYLTVVGFYFRGSATIGDTDSGIVVQFNDASWLAYEITWAGNNGVSFASTEFGSWGSANTWYHGRIILDPVHHTAKAELRDASGAFMSTSSNVSLPSSATTITELKIFGVTWNSLTASFLWDRVTVDGPSIPSAPQSLAATNPAPGEARLTWSLPADDGGGGVQAYKVYASMTPGLEAYVATNDGSLSYTVTGLASGTYHYKVSAINGAGESPLSAGTSVAVHNTPTAPQSLAAASGPGAHEVTLSWMAPADNGGGAATTYHVHRATTSGAETFLASAGTALAYTDTGLQTGTTYHYKVSAINAGGFQGPLSQEASAVACCAPTAPMSMSASNDQWPGSILLGWQPPSSDGGAPIAGYTIHKTDPSGTTTTITPGNVQSYNDTNVAQGASYGYRVTATNSAGLTGPPTDLVTKTAYNAPTQPQDLRAIAAPEAIILKWDVPADDGASNLAQYFIFRGTTSETKFQRPSFVPASQTHFLDSQLPPGATFYYEVTARNGIFTSPRSNEANATALPPFPDGDADGLPDALEPLLCGRALVASLVNATRPVVGNSCASATDYAPPPNMAKLFVPTSVVTGSDADGDGVPANVTVSGITVEPRPYDPRLVFLGSESRVVALDEDDADPNVPVQSVVESPTLIVVGTTLGPDEDRDGVPSSIDVQYASVTFDRRNTERPVNLSPAGSQSTPLDPNDQDPTTPLVSQVGPISVPTSVVHGPDADDDGVPAYVAVSFVDVTIDRTQPNPVILDSHTSQITLDADDGTRDDALPWRLVDADADFVPDAVEPWVCQVEDRTTPDDGTCIGEDYRPATPGLNPWRRI